jgi:uncharacterized membrane protein YdjX (TVP38/TMEM64 family)
MEGFSKNTLGYRPLVSPNPESALDQLPPSCITVAQPASPPVPSTFRRWLPLAVLGAALALTFATGAHKWLSVALVAQHKAALESYVETNATLSVAIYMALYIAVTALSIPGALIMTIAGGLLFSFWTAVPATLVAATTGASVLFLVAQSSFGGTLRGQGGDMVARMADGLKEDAASYMLFLRLVPVFPFAVVNIVPALVGIPLRTFIWTTFVGIMPATTAFTLAAASLDGVIDDNNAAFGACKASGKADCVLSVDLSTLVSPKLLLVFAALGIVALIPVVAKRYLTKKTGKPIV